MQNALIKIIYRQVIDASFEDTFSKNIFNTTYDEFLLKSQAYNQEGKFKTFIELKANDGRANSLHYKTGFVIGNFIEKLNKEIPGLKTSLEQSVLFDTYKFELIESDIKNKSPHKVAVNYISGIITLLDNVGDNLLLAYGDNLTDKTKEPIETFLLKMQRGLSITDYRRF